MVAALTDLEVEGATEEGALKVTMTALLATMNCLRHHYSCSELAVFDSYFLSVIRDAHCLNLLSCIYAGGGGSYQASAAPYGKLLPSLSNTPHATPHYLATVLHPSYLRSLTFICYVPLQVEGAEGAEATTHATSSSRATAPEEATAASPMRAVEAEEEEVEEETIIKVSRANLPSPYIQCIGRPTR